MVGAPGVFDEQTGRVRYAVNLPGWGRSGLVAGMREGLGTSLTLHNDANLAAIGEYACGAGKDSRLFVYILIGTGLGMGVVADGELFRGAHGAAGEIGFLPLLTNPMPPSGPSPVEGAPRRGSLEDAVSGEAVVRGARELGMTGAQALTAKQVFEAARKGDPAGGPRCGRRGSGWRMSSRRCPPSWTRTWWSWAAASATARTCCCRRWRTPSTCSPRCGPASPPASSATTPSSSAQSQLRCAQPAPRSSTPTAPTMHRTEGQLNR
ncbi:hypothetical protein ABH941_005437 [Streptacidiphilus sp. EB103A]